MKKTAIILLLTFTVITVFAQTDFLTEQKRYVQVRTAIADKEKIVIEKLKRDSIELGEVNILILAFKAEGEIEIFAKKRNEQIYRKLATYNICSGSGHLGPKRKQGDCQVPEGFYYIDRFNPLSSYYLSLGINYPNQSDRIKSNASDLGGDIAIHGSCETFGCLPTTDNGIKEIYLYAINAKNNGQKRIPVYIFPFRMTEQKFKNYKEKYKSNSELIDFWTNIKLGYDKFYKEKKELNISFSSKGDYIFK